MEESGQKVGQTLLKAGLVDPDLLRRAEIQQKKAGRRLTEILVSLGVDADVICQALALRLKLPEAVLKDFKLEPEVVGLIPESWVQKHGIIPLERFENTLTLGMVDPFDIEIEIGRAHV